MPKRRKLITKMRVALVHDSFTQLGGAERVVDVLHEMFPEAPVYTLVFDKKLASKYQAWDIRVTWLQKFYYLIPKLQYWFFLIPWAVSSIKIRDADVVISSSSGFVKNIRVPKGSIHINYCHTPARFLWIDKDYVNQEVPFLLRPLVKVFLGWMKKWDLKGSQSVSRFIANSKEVQKRIADVYHRESEVIYPPINAEFWRPTTPKSDYFLVAGRLQAHKRIDLIIEIFNDLKIPLHVVGTGRQEAYLKSIAKPNITFLGRVSDEQLRDEYSGAKAFIYPQVEDFGLMPLEAAACGTPTLAYAQGGALETVVPGVTGELFEDYDKEKIKNIISHWIVEKFKLSDLQAHSRKFNAINFKKSILDILELHV